MHKNSNLTETSMRNWDGVRDFISLVICGTQTLLGQVILLNIWTFFQSLYTVIHTGVRIESIPDQKTRQVSTKIQYSKMVNGSNGLQLLKSDKTELKQKYVYLLWILVWLFCENLITKVIVCLLNKLCRKSHTFSPSVAVRKVAAFFNSLLLLLLSDWVTFLQEGVGLSLGSEVL